MVGLLNNYSSVGFTLPLILSNNKERPMVIKTAKVPRPNIRGMLFQVKNIKNRKVVNITITTIRSFILEETIFQVHPLNLN